MALLVWVVLVVIAAVGAAAAGPEHRMFRVQVAARAQRLQQVDLGQPVCRHGYLDGLLYHLSQHAETVALNVAETILNVWKSGT